MGDVRRKGHNLLDLFRCNVLTLRQLKDVLGPVDDFDGAVRVDLGDVSSQEPAFLVETLSCLVRSLKVSTKNGWTLHADLTARVGFIAAKIRHLREVF